MSDVLRKQLEGRIINHLATRGILGTPEEIKEILDGEIKDFEDGYFDWEEEIYWCERYGYPLPDFEPSDTIGYLTHYLKNLDRS